MLTVVWLDFLQFNWELFRISFAELRHELKVLTSKQEQQRETRQERAVAVEPAVTSAEARGPGAPNRRVLPILRTTVKRGFGQALAETPSTS